MSHYLADRVIEQIMEGTPEHGYNLCFKELLVNPENKEISAALALLSMVVGNNEAAEWYLQDSGDLYDKISASALLDYNFLKYINDQNQKKKWDNYRRNRNQQELKRMAETAPMCNGDVLEIGCANGDLSVFIACHGSKLYGIDIDPVAIDLARHKVASLGIDTARFQVGNGYELHFEDNVFDTVVVAEVLEHVDNPKKIIQEAYRVCKPGGTLIISVPNGYAIPDPDHYNIFTRELLNGLVEFSVGQSLLWNHNVPNEWILGSLIKPYENYEAHHKDIEAQFLPVLYKIPKSRELVSVIVPTYNRKEYIADTIQSILNQTHSNMEIIVIDDGSDSSPEDVLSPFGDKVKYLYKENGGKSSALNEAIKHINGEYIWVFDDDDIALPLKLELQLKKFHMNPEIDMLHTRSINFNDVNGQVVGVHDLTPYQGTLDFKMLMRGCFVHGPTVVFRRRCLEKLEGWDPQLTRAQDYDFWLRLTLNYKAEYLSAPTVRYRIHTSTRGSAADPVSFNEIVSKTAKYEQLIFRKLYRTIPINEMYPDAFKSENVTLMLEAFIERAKVYAARGLIDEVKRDLAIVIDNTKSFGNPCFSGEAIQNIHELGQAAVQGNWEDHEVISSIFEMVKLVTTKD